MQPPIPNFGAWPDLEWNEWKDTAETLHMYMQIVGKTRDADPEPLVECPALPHFARALDLSHADVEWPAARRGI
jgi:Family of unknown function (DUF5996)